MEREGAKEFLIDMSYKLGNMSIEYLSEKAGEKMREAIKALEIGHCKNCKWWKDSDGAFRRGIGAESQCPMNRKEVYEGDGYCFMFKSQESEW